MHDQLRKERKLLETVNLYAGELKISHEAWKEQLLQARPGGESSQIASEALELALNELEDRLPSASNLDEELRRFEYKVEAGAEFVLTRPIFDPANFERFLKRLEPARLPVVAGIFPFESVSNAELMANEVPGVRVPEALIERMRRADGLDREAAEGIAIAREIAAVLRSTVQGVQVSTSSGNIDAVLAVVDGLR